MNFFQEANAKALSLFDGNLKTSRTLASRMSTHAALDPKTSQALMELTDRFVKSDQLTALMITHHMEDALKYGNRLIVMQDGKIIKTSIRKEKAKMTLTDYYQFFE